MRPPRPLLTSVLAAAVGVAVLFDGGFGEATRTAFAILAGVALLLAAMVNDRAASASARSPVVLALAALALLTALSALWSPADPADVLRWALVIAGYASIVISAATVTRERGSILLAAVVITGLAAAGGALGLIAAATGDSPGAERIGGSWRPGGPFEYPPALALLQVSALPILIAAMVQRRRSLALAAAGGAAIAALTIALSQSRLEVLLALAALAASMLPRVWSGDRGARLAAIVLIGVVAVSGYAIAGGLREGGPQAPGYLIGLVSLVLAAMAVWWAAGRLLRLRRTRDRVPRAAASDPYPPSRRAAALVLCLLSIVAVTALSAARSGGGIEPSSGAVLHGRDDAWRAALEVAGDHPIAGAGGESYYLASRAEQGRSPVLYAHDLPLEALAELGALGLICVLGVFAGAAGVLWRRRRDTAVLLLGPAVAAFLVANLVDWPWHLAGSGSIFALALGALLGRSADSDAWPGAAQSVAGPTP